MTIKNPGAPATDAQLNLIDRLLARLSDQDTLDGPSPRSCAYKRLSDGLTKGLASEWIDKLSALPAPEPTGDLAQAVAWLRGQRDAGKLTEFHDSLLSQFESRGSLSDKQLACVMRALPDTNSDPVPLLPAGRYAVTLNGEIALVRVWRGTRDASVQRIYSITGYADRGDRLGIADEANAARAIAVDPGAAAQEFGRRTGHCYRCGDELQVNLSRRLAIGPDCAKHVFENSRRLAMMRQAREDLRAAGLDPAAKFDDLAAVA